MNPIKLLLSVVLALVVHVDISATVRTAVPADFPGPPSYAAVQRRLEDGTHYFLRDGDWIAIPFLRDPRCVPADFNLLDNIDFTPAFPGGPPRPFTCPLTVQGFAIWESGPSTDFAPLFSFFRGTGTPIWFVRWSELEPAAADDILTIEELRAMPSRRVGLARYYSELENLRLPPGSGKLQIVAVGSLFKGDDAAPPPRGNAPEGGHYPPSRKFEFETMEVPGLKGADVAFTAHIRIHFQ